MSEPILECSEISRSYHQGKAALKVLDGASIQLASGELVARVGPSWSGKTTWLQIIGLLDRPDSGEVKILGVQTRMASDKTRTRLRSQAIGFVYQFHHLLPELTALENAMMPLLLQGVPRQKAQARGESLLQQLGLEARLHHLPSELSGGEQQRVAIARALIHKPKLLLADEPTGNLDPATAKTVFDLLCDLAKSEGTAILLVTHNPTLAERMQRRITLHAGKVVSLGQSA